MLYFKFKPSCSVSMPIIGLIWYFFYYWTFGGTVVIFKMEFNCGRIELIIGPMFSGKSTSLLLRIRRLIIAEKKCIVVKYKHDTRYSELCMATHDKSMIEAVPCSRLGDLYEHLLSFDIIGVDEGQFFPDIVEETERLASAGKTVIIAALDGTF
jgi:thymidine kinase